jgi:O-acetyl-ADP-ribose deacetylase (regulator of RNase III)
MITFLKGDMWDYPADARVNTINCVGVMGKGVALEFARRYPRMVSAYRGLCKGGKITPGCVWVYPIAEDLHILNVATKNDWRKNSRYVWIEAALAELRKHIKGYGVVTVPALGCGNGGLNWVLVKPMVQVYLGDLETKVLVFEPQ